jgi:hypothetical protein
VAVFPTDAVCKNFYRELGKFPNRYAKFFQQRQGEKADGVALDMRDVLEMKGLFRKGVVTPSFVSQWQRTHPTARPPAAPLRAYRYTIAGGSASKVRSRMTSHLCPSPSTSSSLQHIQEVGLELRLS